MNEIDQLREQLRLARQHRAQWHGAHREAHRQALATEAALERRLRELEHERHRGKA